MPKSCTTRSTGAAPRRSKLDYQPIQVWVLDALPQTRTGNLEVLLDLQACARLERHLPFGPVLALAVLLLQ